RGGAAPGRTCAAAARTTAPGTAAARTAAAGAATMFGLDRLGFFFACRQGQIMDDREQAMRLRQCFGKLVRFGVAPAKDMQNRLPSIEQDFRVDDLQGKSKPGRLGARIDE